MGSEMCIRDRELDIAMVALEHEDAIVRVLQQVKTDELEHQSAGDDLAGTAYKLSGFVAKIATTGAYSAKYLSSLL